MQHSKDLLVHIPARAGSKRVPKKNLRLLAGKPMIGYAIDAAINANITNNIVVNTDCPLIMKYVETRGDIALFKRDENLANDTATGDDFTADIIAKLNPHVLMMINPVCPLIESTVIRNVYQQFIDSSADTLITCTETRMQVACNQGFINVNPEFPMPPSQLNSPVQICNWAVAIWDFASFISRYQKQEGAYLGLKRILAPIPQLCSFKVSYEDDLSVIESILNARHCISNQPVEARYWQPTLTTEPL